MSELRSHPNPQLTLEAWEPNVPRATPWYQWCRWFFRVSVPTLWHVRVFNRHHEPASGGALYISNHQSFLDPMLVGFGLQRPMSYMARDSLFKPPVLRNWIRSVGAFPVKRGTADMGAIKEAMRRLKAGGQVTVYAEGTRTRNGRVNNFLPGVAMLAQRAADWIVPVAIDGAYEAWPRTQPVPSPGHHIVVQYGEPIAREHARSMKAAELLEEIRGNIIDMQADMRARLGRPKLEY